ncbi:hypothetical protein [Streptomyces sp. NPDC001422]|uniref:hypothetical protein n=1 Tax=Streptomyces sp. NPDC001422 TaxID=3364575 RepID=UPI00368561E1
MAGPTGRGGSLGTALNNLLRTQVTPRHRLSTYSAASSPAPAAATKPSTPPASTSAPTR